MRKALVLSFLCICLAACASAQTGQSGPAGFWAGTFSEAGADVHVSVSFDRAQVGVWSGRFTSYSQGVMEYPFDSVRVNNDSVAFVLGSGDIVATGTMKGDEIAGTFTGEEGKGTWLLHRADAPRYPYRSETVTFNNAAVRLAGTLCIPSGGGRHPAVVLLHGSGPESRWGTNRFIADQLARRGIAALDYDKRGSGDSGGDWRTASYDELADDAIAGIRLLQARNDVNPQAVGIWGHSQGGYIAPLIASRTKSVAFIVAADSPAMPQYQQDIYRVSNLVRDNGWTGKTGQEAMALYTQFIDVARTGQGYDKLRAAMESDKNQPWLDWMQIPSRDSWLWAWYRKTGDYDSRPYWANVTSPVLLVYGEHDELEPVGGSIAIIEKILYANGNRKVEAFILPAAPHVLHIAPLPKQHFFWWYMVPGYPSLVVDWIKGVVP